MRGYFIGLLLCVSFVFGDNSVNGHEMDQERIPSEAAVEPLDPPPYCTERQAEAYVKQACGVINIAASCSDGQKMVDCAEKELRIKCSKEMVQEACDNWLPEFLKKIHSSCNLTCSANSHFIIGSIAAMVLSITDFEALTMAIGNQCCCLHIKTCAAIVGTLGLIVSILAAIPCIFIWIGIFGVFPMILTYTFIVVGVHKKSSGWMLAAEIILGIKITLCIIACIVVLILGFASANFAEWIYKQTYSHEINYGYSTYEAEKFKETVQMVFILVVLTILALSSWNIYSCIIVHRARNWFEENNAPLQQRFYPYGYGVGPMQVHVHNSSNPSQHPGTTPQGYVSDAPHFPNQLQSNNPSPAVYPKIIYPSAPTQGQPQSGLC